ncbi:hypothetical protein [Clostridium porci]|uniref:Uncharacterized protein n=1 Tax=Clostridium porci TaxID=2605778 RepID=A0A7X2NKQ5_9CLOT|nr:hypothetical protein [Clostridium porci]MSS36471.1 hypothetical protein [Clostridium porci]
MKMKKIVTMMAAAAMTAAMAMTAMAAPFGSWQQNENGWWWQREDGSYPANSWVWIDGNADGVAECYYFDASGYMVADSITSDGYTVNTDGAWVANGVVQAKAVNADLGGYETAMAGGVTAPAAEGVVMDGKSVEQMTINMNLVNTLGKAGAIDLFPNKTNLENHAAFQYKYEYKNQPILIHGGMVDGQYWVQDYLGTADQIFNNFPKAGIELNAFYDNCGYESHAWQRRVIASSGSTDMVFQLPTGSYRLACGSVDKYCNFDILLTAGNDGQWYIYPNSKVWLH